ncbi:unnamed protein product [Danaus chrysippus]|uniref:(African queen) hypothetical protein n=1 Tax=Danaus chrysippus TaxID=151541 RepID=A0A8J2QNC3_9NEOP|nr:unnamed protein product [Danaus chrysippus]
MGRDGMESDYLMRGERPRAVDDQQYRRELVVVYKPSMCVGCAAAEPEPVGQGRRSRRGPASLPRHPETTLTLTNTPLITHFNAHILSA